MLIKQSYRIG